MVPLASALLGEDLQPPEAAPHSWTDVSSCLKGYTEGFELAETRNVAADKTPSSEVTPDQTHLPPGGALVEDQPSSP